MTITATPEQIPMIVAEAESAAHAAADQYFRQELGGRDQFACGFAWDLRCQRQHQVGPGLESLRDPSKLLRRPRDVESFKVWMPERGHSRSWSSCRSWCV